MTIFIDENFSPNFWEGRCGYSASAFVIHTAEGSGASLLSYLKNSNSRVSYHYLILDSGDIVNLVNPDNTAWHAGKIYKPVWPRLIENVNPNLYTIGLAFEGFAHIGPNMKQVCRMAVLLQHLSNRYNICLDLRSVIPHNWIRSDKSCPGFSVSILALNYLSGLRP